jgi:hypothetical protein
MNFCPAPSLPSQRTFSVTTAVLSKEKPGLQGVDEDRCGDEK